MAITRGFVGAVSGLVGVRSQCLPGWLSSAITTFVVVAVGTLSTAQAQNRAALCEREADAEQVFAYLQTAVEAGDRAGANACADAYLELAPRGAHVREANELVASMVYRPDVSLHAPPSDVPPPAVGQSQDITGWLVLGVSGAFAVAGAVLLGVAASDASAVEQSTSWRDVSAAYDRIPAFAGVGWTALALGVVGAGIGIALQVSSDGSRNTLSLQIQPGGLVLRGAF